MESVWSGSSSGAFFDADALEKSRRLESAESENTMKNKNHYYVISVDVARTKSCQTAITIFKVEPQPYGASLKKLVNIFTYEEEHFGFQALRLKQLYERYQPKQIVIDANGLGIGLIDFMVIPTVDPETGEVYPGFTPSNDESGLYKRFEQAEGVVKNSIFMVKANAQLNTIMHSNTAIQMKAGRIQLLVDERQKKAELLSSVRGEAMSQSERAAFLRPYALTGILKEEMLNLREETEGVNIILKRESARLTKDKFSAFEMGLYYIKYLEDTGKKKKKFGLSELMFIN